MLFDLLRIIESTGFTERMVTIDIIQSETIQISSRLITYTAAKTGNHSYRVEMFFVNFVTFAFWKLFFCHDSLENVAGSDDF